MNATLWLQLLVGAAAAAFLLAVLVNLKTSRPDGVLVRHVHPYRQLLWYIMPTRNESIVYYDTFVRADRLTAYLAEANRRFPCDVTHLLVGAAFSGLVQNPKMNQFVVGRRLYARKGHFITFSMKRQRLNREAKLSAVKLQLGDGETFAGLCARINAEITHEQSGARTYADREFDFFTFIPRPLLMRAVNLFRALDHHNLLPGSFIATDAMYTSIFVANLGSLEMSPGYHHLYEWGTCPLFMMVGKIEERAMVEDGQVVIRRVLPIRWSYDERIDDGLTSRFGIDAVNRCLEDPYTHLGCLAEDGRDARPIGGARSALA